MAKKLLNIPTPHPYNYEQILLLSADLLIIKKQPIMSCFILARNFFETGMLSIKRVH